MLAAAVAIAALVGLVVGSFLGTLVLRPPKGMPVVSGRSMCPRCGHQLKASELIPVVSWLIQRRRCRACGQPIPVFYPLMEIAGAAIAALSVAFVPWPFCLAACTAGWIILVTCGRLLMKGDA
jgi:leader peptidase (prepilin peptidase)/N-methyltransferase